MTDSIRPSKKQRELLAFIETFIGEHGYSPSYREIMVGCNYTSVATVALHVNNLIKRGHLRKRENNARSLEVVSDKEAKATLSTNQIKPAEEKWLIEKVEHFFQSAEQQIQNDPVTLQNLQTLLDALKVLGIEGAAQSYVERFRKLRETTSGE
jgi:SOS-response transcriptional repressor LexA